MRWNTWLAEPLCSIRELLLFLFRSFACSAHELPLLLGNNGYSSRCKWVPNSSNKCHWISFQVIVQWTQNCVSLLRFTPQCRFLSLERPHAQFPDEITFLCRLFLFAISKFYGRGVLLSKKASVVHCLRFCIMKLAVGVDFRDTQRNNIYSYMINTELAIMIQKSTFAYQQRCQYVCFQFLSLLEAAVDN